MLSLNIIPKSLKNEIKLQIAFIKIKNLLALFLLIALLYTISFVISRLVLEIHSIETIQKTTITTNTQDDRSKQVRTINNDIGIVKEIQSEYVEWSYLLENLIGKISGDITVNQITTNTNVNLITLKGLARTRDSLLNLKDLLESSPELKNVEFPIKNLLQKENINFEITAQFENYEFKD